MEITKIHYVCGFLFNPEMTQVVLIEKNKPEWQAGFLNGVGGKIESSETPAEAMRREFREEADLDVDFWHEFAQIDNELWTVHFFATTSPNFNKVKTMTEEVIHILPVQDLFKYKVIENLRWLIPMTKDSRHIFTRSQSA